MTTENIKVTGLAELEKSLLQLETLTATKVLRSALFKSTTQTVKKMALYAPDADEDGKGYPETIGRKSSVNKRGDSDTIASVFIGSVKKTKDGQKRSRIAHLLEFGHSGAPAYPHIRRAVDEDKVKIVETFRDALRKGIEKANNV